MRLCVRCKHWSALHALERVEPSVSACEYGDRGRERD